MEPTANTAGLRFYSHIAPITTQRKQKTKRLGVGTNDRGREIKKYLKENVAQEGFQPYQLKAF